MSGGWLRGFLGVKHKGVLEKPGKQKEVLVVVGFWCFPVGIPGGESLQYVGGWVPYKAVFL